MPVAIACCRLLAGLAIALAAVPALNAQDTPAIDFVRDVQPIFRQYCYGCHGPSQQRNGLRLDRRSSAFRLRRVAPGSPENSFLYARVSMRGFGQMPPGGSLSPEQVRVLKSWIEQGAQWPDSAANEADHPPVDPAAVSLVQMLVDGKRQSFMAASAKTPKLLNARGPGGATPFLYAVRYLDVPSIRKLLALGADPKIPNDVKTTALMWAGADLGKTRLLVEHGADVNAISDDRRTALMVAAGRPGGDATVKFLLEHRANPNPTANPSGDSSPLALAAGSGSAESLRLLLGAGADLKASGILALSLALASGCRDCVATLMSRDLGPLAYSFGFVNSVTSAGLPMLRSLIDRGADVNIKDFFGRTPLMYAAVSDRMPVDTVRLLLDRGANVNAISEHQNSADSGLSVLDIALLNGETPVAELIRKAGGKSALPAVKAPVPAGAPDARTALQRSIPVIQRGDEGFSAKAGCISCHNNNLAALVVSSARRIGVPVDEQVASRQLKANAAYLRQVRESLSQGFFPAQAGAEAFGNIFGPSVLGYMLIALDAEGHKRDLDTDAAVMYLAYLQRADGHWEYAAANSRAPLCDDEIAQTALSMRSLQLYAPKQPQYDRAIRLASAWLAETSPTTTNNKLWKLQGLAWSGRNREATRNALRQVLAAQRADGGWSDLPTTESNAFETGQALAALHTAGVAVTDPAYRRGIQFLLKSQMADGSWFVRSRALGSQSYFEADFPHGVHQSISAAGTSWASLALSSTLPATPAAARQTRKAGVTNSFRSK